MEWPKDNTYPEVREWLLGRFNSTSERRESEARIRVLLEWYTRKNRAMLIAMGHRFTESDLNRLKAHSDALISGVPVQHITGEVLFMEQIFKVGKEALVPRPETEELVHLIHADLSGNPPTSILDIGTGTGIIPISLKSKFPGAEVEAWDISEDALKLAKENSIVLEVEVDFKRKDVLTTEPNRRFDLVVSNPPYITQQEMYTMQPEVVNHEPHIALFVPDNDPLLFYRRIFDLKRELLNEGGNIYFECHENYAQEVADLFSSLCTAKVHQDAQGKSRFVSVKV